MLIFKIKYIYIKVSMASIAWSIPKNQWPINISNNKTEYHLILSSLCTDGNCASINNNFDEARDFILIIDKIEYADRNELAVNAKFKDKILMSGNLRLEDLYFKNLTGNTTMTL